MILIRVQRYYFSRIPAIHIYGDFIEQAKKGRPTLFSQTPYPILSLHSVQTLCLQIQALLDSLNLLQGSLGATLIATCTLEAVILDFTVELNLGLST